MNLKHLLELLSADGMSDADIGKEVDAPQSIITRLRNGDHKSTSYERGDKIRQLAIQRGVIKGVDERRRSPGRRNTDTKMGRRTRTPKAAQ